MDSLSDDDDSLVDERDAVIDVLITQLQSAPTDLSVHAPALEDLELAAAHGDVAAMYQLGRVYQHGLEDPVAAVRWYGAASKRADIRSADRLSDVVDTAEHDDVRIAALIQLREAADAGVEPAALRLARALEARVVEDVADVAAALDIYERLTMDGNEEAAEGLGRIAINELCDVDVRKGALRCLREAAFGGDGCAAHLLAGIYEDGTGVLASNVHEAVRLYGSVCKGDEWWAEDSVSSLSRLARGIDSKTSKKIPEDVRILALEQLKHAALQGSPRPALILANVMRQGLDFLRPNLSEAVNLYGIACKNNPDDISAAAELARVIRRGSDVSSDLKENALQRLRDAADGGVTQAALELAYVLEDGADNASIDLASAIEIYGILSLCDEDHAPQALVRIAESGKWFPDAAKKSAVQKLRDAAREGNATAKMELAAFTMRGCDVCPPDFHEAVRLYADLIGESPFISAEKLGSIARAVDGVPNEAKKAAFQTLSQAVVEDGLLCARYEVALTLEEGSDVVPEDKSRAVKLYGELCKSTFSGAVERLALIAHSEQGISAEVQEQAVQELVDGTKRGYSPAMFEVAQIMEDGTTTVKANIQKAVQLYGLANMKEHAEASAALFRIAKGVSLKSGDETIPEDAQRSAVEQLQNAAKDGDDMCALRVAELIEKGTASQPADIGLAMVLYGELAAGQEYDAVDALVRIARGADGSRATAAERTRAFEVLQNVANHENEYAAAMLGQILEDGAPPIARDLGRAVDLYMKGCRRGNHIAAEGLGRIVRNAEPTSRELRWRAFATLQHEERMGKRVAMIEVAETLADGAGDIGADPGRSLELYDRFCMRREDEIMTSKATIGLGRLARSEFRVAGEAKKCLERGAASFDLNSTAVEVLAALLADGREEDRDMGRAVRLYRTIVRKEVTTAYAGSTDESVDERLVSLWKWTRGFVSKVEVESMRKVARALETEKEMERGEDEKAVDGRLAWLLRLRLKTFEEADDEDR